MIKKCTSCDKEYRCSSNTQENSCWCESYPKELLSSGDNNCLCSSCLASSIAAVIKNLIKKDHIGSLTRIAETFRDESLLYPDIDYTIEDDKYVFTEWYLLKRGFCCNSGCRNCPYPKDKPAG